MSQQKIHSKIGCKTTLKITREGMPMTNTVARQYCKVMRFGINSKHLMGMLVEMCPNVVKFS